MRESLIVGLGGCIGSVLRLKTGALFLHLYPQTKLPLGTLTVNVLGCLLVGIIASCLERLSVYNAELRFFLITGFLGGFTTFSAFGLETYALLRSNLLALAVANVALNVIVGLCAVWLGMRLGSFLTT